MFQNAADLCEYCGPPRYRQKSAKYRPVIQNQNRSVVISQYTTTQEALKTISRKEGYDGYGNRRREEKRPYLHTLIQIHKL